MFTIISNKGIKTMNKPMGVNQDNRIATIIALKRVFWGVALTLLVAALLAAIIVIGSHPVYRDYLVYGAVVLSTLLRSEEHTSELQSRPHLVCRLLLEKKKIPTYSDPQRTC